MILSQLSDNLIKNRYPNDLANVLHKAIFNEEVVHEKNSFQRLSANVQIMNKNLAILCLITKACFQYIFYEVGTEPHTKNCESKAQGGKD